jgi:hypothetical protein
MKRIIYIVILSVTLVSCKKEDTSTIVDGTKNPELISVSIDESTSNIVRVR